METIGKGPRLRKKLKSLVLNNVELRLTLRHPKISSRQLTLKFKDLEKSGIKIKVLSLKVVGEATGLAETA